MATLRLALEAAVRRLAEAGVDDPDREGLWLLAHVINCSAGALRLRLNEPLAPAQAEEFGRLVSRRADREPIQYILGTEEFMGMTFRVTPAVLIPRLDTEVLVREAAARLQGDALVADIGTGSGAIAIGIARLVLGARVTAVDISADALAVAQCNATANGYAERIEFRQGDLAGPLAGCAYDAILSNPPYIDESEVTTLMPEVRDWEPRIALTPGADGYLMYRRLIAEALPLLKPQGFLGVEVGIGQAPAVADLFRTAGLNVSVHADTAGIQRAVFGRRS